MTTLLKYLNNYINGTLTIEGENITFNNNGSVADIYHYPTNPIGVHSNSNKGSLALTGEGELFQYVGDNTNNTDWMKMYAIPDNIKIINTQADWDDMASGGVITISSSLYIVVNCIINTSHTIFINPGQTFYITCYNNGNALVNYNGSGTFITGYNIGFSFINKTNQFSNFPSFPIPSRGTGTLCDINGANGNLWQDNIFWGWGSMGSVRNCGIFDVNNALVGDCGSVTVSGIQNHSFQRVIYNTAFFGGPSLNEPLIRVERADSLSSYLFVLGTAFKQSTEPLLYIDPALDITSRVLITNTYLGKLNSDNQELFDTTEDNTNSITSISNSSLSGIVISSVVSGNNGFARFNFTGPTVYTGQKVNITSTNYNTSLSTISATDNTSWFEVAPLAYSVNDTGTFSSDSITITTPSTGTLSDGNSVILYTNNGGGYDVGSLVYNVSPTTFQMNEEYTNTTTGTWTTKSLDKTNINVITTNNSGNTDSKSIAFAYVNNNTTTTTLAAPTDLLFGTAGNALIAGSNTERFRLINDVNGEIEYIGLEPFQGFLIFNLSASGQGGSFSTYTFNFQIDTGGGFNNLEDNVISTLEVSNDVGSVSCYVPLVMKRGDKVKPQLLSATKTLTVKSFKITII